MSCFYASITLRHFPMLHGHKRFRPHPTLFALNPFNDRILRHFHNTFNNNGDAFRTLFFTVLSSIIFNFTHRQPSSFCHFNSVHGPCSLSSTTRLCFPLLFSLISRLPLLHHPCNSCDTRKRFQPNNQSYALHNENIQRTDIPIVNNTSNNDDNGFRTCSSQCNSPIIFNNSLPRHSSSPIVTHRPFCFAITLHDHDPYPLSSQAHGFLLLLPSFLDFTSSRHSPTGATRAQTLSTTSYALRIGRIQRTNSHHSKP
jgi:hypothetical protein